MSLLVCGAVTWLDLEFHLSSYINIFGINNERASPQAEYAGPKPRDKLFICPKENYSM